MDSVDHFARLPTDILLAILSRLGDLKHIFQCSLVSKRFASTIYQVKSVSLSLPTAERPSIASANAINALFPKLAALTSEEAIRFIRSSPIKEMKFLTFLRNFNELRTISLEFVCPSIVCSSSLFKMRVKFGGSGGGAMVEKFVSIISSSTWREAEYVENMWDEEESDPRRKSSISGTFLPIGCCTTWLLALCLLVKCNPSLEFVAITNGKKQGRLLLEGDKLVAWRNSLIPGGFLHDFRRYASTRGWIAKLRMPASRFLLEGVDFVIARPGGRSRPRSRVEENATIWEYKGEERLLNDALSEYLRKYGDPFIASELNY